MKPRPGHDEIEVFKWFDLAMYLNVTKALEMVGAPYAEPDGFVQVESLRESHSISHITTFDRADFSEPVLIATIGGVRLLVDGRHRAKKALVHRKSKLPCYILTEKETQKCFEGKQQQQRYYKLRDFLRKVEIQVQLYPEIRRAEKTSTTHGHHPPTVRRPR